MPEANEVKTVVTAENVIEDILGGVDEREILEKMKGLSLGELVGSFRRDLYIKAGEGADNNELGPNIMKAEEMRRLAIVERAMMVFKEEIEKDSEEESLFVDTGEPLEPVADDYNGLLGYINITCKLKSGFLDRLKRLVAKGERRFLNPKDADYHDEHTGRVKVKVPMIWLLSKDSGVEEKAAPMPPEIMEMLAKIDQALNIALGPDWREQVHEFVGPKDDKKLQEKNF